MTYLRPSRESGDGIRCQRFDGKWIANRGNPRFVRHGTYCAGAWPVGPVVANGNAEQDVTTQGGHTGTKGSQLA